MLKLTLLKKIQGNWFWIFKKFNNNSIKYEEWVLEQMKKIMI